MARRKKKRSQRRTRRSRGSAMGQLDVTALLYNGVGGLGSKLLDRVLPSTWDRKMVAGGKMALGIAMPMLVKDTKTKKMLSEIGGGMVAVSLVDLIGEFGFMQGIGFSKPNKVEELAVVIDQSDKIQADVLGADVLGADDDIDVVNGDIPVMNGSDFETEMQDYMLD